LQRTRIEGGQLNGEKAMPVILLWTVPAVVAAGVTGHYLVSRGGAPTGKRNGNYRDGTRTKEAVQAARLISLLSRFARKS
jgi:hypothetical protein